MTKKYAYKGTNSDKESCDVCGRTGLKKVIWLAELDVDGNELGHVIAAGTTCGATLLGYSQKNFTKAIKSANQILEQKKSAAYHNHPLNKEAWKIRKELQKTLSGRALRKSAEFIRTKEMMRQARNEAYNQDFTITI
jgi:hypothetical protein